MVRRPPDILLVLIFDDDLVEEVVRGVGRLPFVQSVRMLASEVIALLVGASLFLTFEFVTILMILCAALLRPDLVVGTGLTAFRVLLIR